MSNTNVLLNDKSLEKFMNAVKISQKTKDIILPKISEMDKEERVELFKMLTKIKILDLEREETLKKIGK